MPSAEEHENQIPDVLTLKPTRAGMHICDTQGRLILRDVAARLTLSDGSQWDTRNADWEASSRGWHARATPGDIKRPAGDFCLEWQIEPSAGGLVFRLSLTNTGSAPLRLRHLDVLVASPPAARPSRLRVRQTGYQSWSPATPPQALAEQKPLPGGTIAGPWQTDCPEGIFWSPWCTTVQPSDGPALVWGFLSALRALGCIGLFQRPAALTCVARQYAEDVAVQPGQAWQSDAVLLLAGTDETRVLAEYASRARKTMDPEPPPTRHFSPVAPTGWCSWYTAYEGVDEALVRNTLAQLRKNRVSLDVVLIDDGYQAAIGDWLTVNDKFPGGLTSLVREIQQAGFRAGLWWAPFIAAESSVIWREHPDWFLRDEHGTPTLALFNWNTRCYALDLSHPAVLAHLTHTTRHMVEAWGFNFLKLDFLYAAALPGRRHLIDHTSIQAYHQGLTAIRRAAGPAFLLGCGAPLLPSVGLVDAMRIGPDVAGNWFDPDPEGSAPALENALRATLARGWMHTHWWLNDPDCVFLSATHPPATEIERGTLATTALLTGGLMFFSDPVQAVPPEGWEVWETLRDIQGHPLQAFAPNRAGLATRAWTRSRRNPNQYWLAYFNWSTRPAKVLFKPEEWPQLPPEPWEIRDGWTKSVWRRCPSASLETIPPHGAYLLSIRTRATES